MKDEFKNIISIGKEKGEWNFFVRATIQDLTFEEMNEFRSMVMVAIGSAESIWRRRAVDERDGMCAKNNI